MSRRATVFILAICAAASWTGVALAQNAHSPVPVDTKITVLNWQQYKDYLSDGYQALLSGKYHWIVPDQAVLEVRPRQSYPLPPKFWRDTEKYGSQAKLRQLPDGGYTIEGYVGGNRSEIQADLWLAKNCCTTCITTTPPLLNTFPRLAAR